MFHNETSGVCECSDIPYRAVLCDPIIPRTSILDCYCMTFNKERNETELGRCVYGCGHKKDTVYHELPLKKAHLNHTCEEYNRDSTLCGACKSGYSPLVYSYELKCMNCTGMTYNWIKYIAVAYIPLTFFFLFVVLFRLNGTSPLLRGFITVCQGFVSPVTLRVGLKTSIKKSFLFDTALKVTGSIYGIWNLDFFRLVVPPICLNISPLQALVLDYAIAFYPLLLIVLTYALISLHSRDVRIVVYLWKPFQKIFHSIKQDWDMEGSIVKAFATFFLLSYLKILNVTFDLLVYTNQYTLPFGEQNYYTRPALYYAASLEYFQGEHLFYGLAAIFIGIFFVILPLVFLVIYPMRWFQKLLNKFKIQRLTQSLDMFVNCYQGYYKDGTSGTKDCRCFCVTFFLFQLTVLVLFFLSKSIYCLSIGALISILFMFFVLALRPYKEQFKAYNIIDAFMLLYTGVICIVITAADEADTKASYFSTGTYTILAGLTLTPLIYIVALSIWWIIVKRNIKRLLPCFRRKEENNEYEENADFADRLENPQTYNATAAPLLRIEDSNPHHGTKYGTAELS